MLIRFYVSSYAHTGLVSVFCHEIAEDFMAVKEFAVQTLLCFSSWLRIGVFYPNVALIVLFDKYPFNNTKSLTLLRHFSFQILEENRCRPLHLEHVSHNQIWGSDSRNGWPHEVWVAWSANSRKLIHKVSLATSIVQKFVACWNFSFLLDCHYLDGYFLLTDLYVVHLLHC